MQPLPNRYIDNAQMIIAACVTVHLTSEAVATHRRVRADDPAGTPVQVRSADLTGDERRPNPPVAISRRDFIEGVVDLC